MLMQLENRSLEAGKIFSAVEIRKVQTTGKARAAGAARAAVVIGSVPKVAAENANFACEA